MNSSVLYMYKLLNLEVLTTMLEENKTYTFKNYTDKNTIANNYYKIYNIIKNNDKVSFVIETVFHGKHSKKNIVNQELAFLEDLFNRYCKEI